MENNYNYLKRFQSSISSIRSHHWKYYADIYLKCSFNCKYCLYHSQNTKNTTFCKKDIETKFNEELNKYNEKGILYLGATSDIYQPIEGNERNTRKILELILKYEIPTFLITRSNLILNDLDILTKLSQKGLIEVSITINTRNDDFRNFFEPLTISHHDRIKLAGKIADQGIPTSFHFSPLIPFLDTTDELIEIIRDMNSVAHKCIYACMLGIEKENADFLFDTLSKYDIVLLQKIQNSYTFAEDGTITPKNDVVLNHMQPLADYCKKHSIPFSCAQIPALDTVCRTGGIFEYKLPTIGDINYYFSTNNYKRINLSELIKYLLNFSAVDLIYLKSILEYWENKELLLNTRYVPFENNKKVIYYEVDSDINLGVSVMKCTKE